MRYFCDYVQGQSPKYVQVQSPKKGVREYFYYIDHQGQVRNFSVLYSNLAGELPSSNGFFQIL